MNREGTDTVLESINQRLARIKLKVSPGLKTLLEDVAGQLEERLSGAQRYVVAHGDFAPWNILEPPSRSRICVVDWESTAAGRPALHDYYHFHLLPRALSGSVDQSDLEAVLQLSADATVRKWQRSMNPRSQLLAYLADVTTYYLDADDGLNEQNPVVLQYSQLLRQRRQWLFQ